MFSRFRQSGLSRDTWLLMIAMAIWSLGYFGIITLLRTLYVIRLGFGPKFIGAFGASGAITFALTSLPGGALAAKYGVKRTMVVGVCVGVLMSFVQPLATYMPRAWAGPWMIATQVARIAGWCLFSVNFVPMIAEVTSPERRAGAFALSGTLRGLGSFLGTMVGGVLPALFGGLADRALSDPLPYHWSVLVGACVMVLTLVPLLMVKAGGVKSESRRRAADVDGKADFRLRDMLPLMSYVFLNHSGWAIPQNFWNAYMDTVLHMATSSIGVVTGIGQFLSMLSPMLSPLLTKKRGHSWTLVLCSACMTLGLLPMVLMRDAVSLSIGRLAVLAASAMWIPTLQAFQMARVGEAYRAKAYGALQMGMGTAFATMSMIGGYVIVALGYPAIFGIGAVMTTGATALMARLRRRDTAGKESLAGADRLT